MVNNRYRIKRLLILLFTQVVFDMITIFVFRIGMDNPLLLIIKKILLLLILAMFNRYLLKTKIFYTFEFSGETKKFFILIMIIEVLLAIMNPGKIIMAISIGLMAGIVEEYLCRGLIFGTLYQLFKRKKTIFGKLIVPILLTNLIFSSEHLLNLSSQSLIITGGQMIQTFGMGILFTCLYIRTQNLIVPMIAHFTLDSVMIFLLPITQSDQVNPMITFGQAVVVMTIYILFGIKIIKPVFKQKFR
ncbi:lysostaphin resistance A-like protein [Fructilactobacillus sanfranciscensis]|uniref:CPBP family intramembrane glutamic endopeptidase n=1 Tax=Fructilactobacillus sanfranciscensis TaxID=1625 RepID=UPI001EC254AA|nr:CPBP family intramembrane metalloprotease [Fructilactobacillus sanfranciscensis]